MPNNSAPDELKMLLQTVVKPNWAASDVNNYYDPVTLAAKVPTSNPDRLLQTVVEGMLQVRNPASFGYNAPMSDAEKIDFYYDLDQMLQAFMDALTEIKGPVNDTYVSLTA